MGFFSQHNNIIRNVRDGKLSERRLSTQLYPKIEKSSEDLYIVTVRGDRLDLLADKFYGDTRYWKILAQANNIGKHSLIVSEGTRLRIPQDIPELERLFVSYNESR